MTSDQLAKQETPPEPLSKVEEVVTAPEPQPEVEDLREPEPLPAPETKPEVDAKPEPEAEPEYKAKPAPEAKPVAPQKRASPLPAILGGIIAAACGFGLAQVVPQGWPIGQDKAALTALETRLAKLETGAPADLATRLERLEAAPAEILAQVRAELAKAPQSGPELTALQAEVQALQDQLTNLPQTQTSEEIAALKASLEAERAATEAKAEALRAEAELTARRALAQGAVLRVQAALDTGGDFAPALADLAASGVSLPPELSTQAAGVASLIQLQTDFPDTARATLAALATPGPEASLSERFSAFVKVQTGLRSLTPLEGNSPDAILSRAEAALATGDLTRTLAELDQLPPEAAPALAPWRERAETRHAVARALAELATNVQAEKN